MYQCWIGSLRSELVEHGGITGLAGCLSHTDTRVVSTSTQAIALLAVDSNTREQVSRSAVCIPHHKQAHTVYVTHEFSLHAVDVRMNEL